MLKENTEKINRLLPYIPTADSTQTNNLIYAAAKTIAELMGKKFEKKVKRKKKKEAPPWKIRLTSRVNQVRKDLSILTEMKNQKIRNIKIIAEIKKKYNLEKNPIKSCIEELKQEITAISHKIQQYTARCEIYCQNKMFDKNQRRFYGDLFDKNYQQSNEMPDKKETTAFLSSLWGKTKQHNENAEWMPGVEVKLQDIPQDNLDITTVLVKKAAKSMMSWKSPGRQDPRILDKELK